MLRGLLLALLAAAWLPASGLTVQTQTQAVLLMQARLKTPPVLRGEFEQAKTLRGFKNKLLSRGEFLLARDQGVWWHTRQPFESTLVVTKTRLFTRHPDGSTHDLMDAQAEPGIKQVNELVFALLAADAGPLADKFYVLAQPVGAAGWSLTLTPRDTDIAKFIVRATLTGERDLQTVHIEEPNGDSTEIRFSQQMPSAALTADEAARFQ